MDVSAVLAAGGVLVVVGIGTALAWKKSRLMWPYVYVAWVATTTVVFLDVFSEQTMAAILSTLLTIVCTAVAFSDHDRPMVVCVSATVVAITCVIPAIPVAVLFVPLAIAGIIFVLGIAFFTATHDSCRVFVVGAAVPIGVLDTLYAVTWQRHFTLVKAFAINDATSKEVAFVSVAVALGFANGLVSIRRKSCAAFSPVITGSFWASLGATTLTCVLLDNAVSMKAFTVARVVAGVALCVLGWLFRPTTTSLASSPHSLVKAPATASSTLPPTEDSGVSELTTPSGNYARDVTNV